MQMGATWNTWMVSKQRLCAPNGLVGIHWGSESDSKQVLLAAHALWVPLEQPLCHGANGDFQSEGTFTDNNKIGVYKSRWSIC